MGKVKTAMVLAAGIVLCAALFAGCAAAVNGIDTQQKGAVMEAVFNAIGNGGAETPARYMSDEYAAGDNIAQMAVDGWKIAGYNATRATEIKANGLIINFEDFDVVQLLMLLLSAGELALMIIAIVACAKSKVRRKALWIVLIVLLHTGFSLTMSPAGFRFNIWILNVSLSSLQKFTDGTRVYNVLVPLGAILFLCLKKKLERSAVRHQMMRQYRQDYVPPYAPSEDPPEEVMGGIDPQPPPDTPGQAGSEPPKLTGGGE